MIDVGKLKFYGLCDQKHVSLLRRGIKSAKYNVVGVVRDGFIQAYLPWPWINDGAPGVWAPPEEKNTLGKLVFSAIRLNRNTWAVRAEQGLIVDADNKEETK